MSKKALRTTVLNEQPTFEGIITSDGTIDWNQNWKIRRFDKFLGIEIKKFWIKIRFLKTLELLKYVTKFQINISVNWKYSLRLYSID